MFILLDAVKAVQSNIKQSLLDQAGDLIFAADVTEAGKQALRILNRDSPAELYVTITGDASKSYALPSTFKRNFSVIRTVEFPAGEDPPIFLKEGLCDDYFFYFDDSEPVLADKNRIRFGFIAPTIAQTFIVKYTGLHVLTGTADENFMTPSQFQAYVSLQTSICFDMLAARTANSIDPTISADVVELRFNSREFQTLSEKWMGLYRKEVGLDRDITAGQHVTEVDIKREDNSGYIYHRSRNR